MLTKERLKSALESFDGHSEVHLAEERSLIATVISGSFVDQDEAERQERVFQHLADHESFSLRDLSEIEFIFTNTPEEAQHVAYGYDPGGISAPKT